jgi:hypothetical protein
MTRRCCKLAPFVRPFPAQVGLEATVKRKRKSLRVVTDEMEQAHGKIVGLALSQANGSQADCADS